MYFKLWSPTLLQVTNLMDPGVDVKIEVQKVKGVEGIEGQGHQWALVSLTAILIGLVGSNY